jgi:signal transduction histidine kinase
MSGVIAAMRRYLLSFTSLTGAGAFAGFMTASGRASAAESGALGWLESAELSRPDAAALVLGLAFLGFSVLSAGLLMRTRLRASRETERLQAELQRTHAESDRYRALLFVEPQVLVSWPAGGTMPQISGDVSLLQDSSQPAQRLLAFGTWLLPEQAVQMDRAVDRLLQSGEGFLLHLSTANGRSVEAMGRAIGGQAILRIRELGGLRRDFADLSLRHKALQDDSEALRGFAAEAPWPIWSRRPDGALMFANAAYAEATEAGGAADAIARNLELLGSEDRDTLVRSLEDKGEFSARVPVVVAGARRVYDVVARRIGAATAGMAIDASEAAALADALARMTDAHRRTLDQLSSGVAVFDGQRRLAFYNESYRKLWDLDPTFLDQAPDDSGVLDRLRAARKLPEQADFRAWKNRLHEAYRAVESSTDVWYLPDGRALSVVMTPNPEGGVTYLFDDVTESLELARRFDRLINVQRETLDNLAEAVAVFGSNGRAQLFNPAFARMWDLDAEALAGQPHIEVVESWCRPLSNDTTAWDRLRRAVTSIDERNPVRLKLERLDGTVLACMTMPLPDGATMLTFQDISDTENVERALRERNEALETADQMKVDLVHHVSYELRSPLTSIIGFAHFLTDPATGPLTEKQREYIGYITSSTDALMAIINNILDLATIDAGAMTLTLGEVDIRRAIEAAAEGVQDRLARERIALQVVADPTVGSFVADEKRVIQVLYNLLANAVGFAPPDSAITVNVRRTPDQVIFSVMDSGAGIAPELKDKVFDWFESHPNGSRHRGAGLGLSLVRSFVELHGGRVRVDSVVGEGTIVTCSFPADQAAQRSAAE